MKLLGQSFQLGQSLILTYMVKDLPIIRRQTPSVTVEGRGREGAGKGDGERGREDEGGRRRGVKVPEIEKKEKWTRSNNGAI